MRAKECEYGRGFGGMIQRRVAMEAKCGRRRVVFGDGGGGEDKIGRAFKRVNGVVGRGEWGKGGEGKQEEELSGERRE